MPAYRPTDCAVCYVSDLSFLLPTLASISTLRRWVRPETAVVHLVTLDVDGEVLEKLSEVFAGLAVRLWPSTEANISGYDPEQYCRTHVPTSTLGRLALPEDLLSSAQRIVYVDGDTLFVRDPGALIAYVPPDGMLAACEGVDYFYRNHPGQAGDRARAYCAGLGIDIHRGYFNGGVLAARIAAWREIAANALVYFCANTAKCHYQDESAVNAVAQHRRVRLSPRWNFQTQYRFWGVERMVAPALYHFAGGIKPWSGKLIPWMQLDRMYETLFAPYAEARLPLHRFTAEEQAIHNRGMRSYLLKLNSVQLPRKLERALDFRSLLPGCALGR